MINEDISNISRENILLYKKSKVANKSEVDKKKKDDLEISKYDFIPKINNSNNIKILHGQTRFDMLYKVAK